MTERLTWASLAVVLTLTAGCAAGNTTDADADRVMKAGMDALYTANDPETAITHFRQVLAVNAQHYGATYQLAAALDKAGRRDEARPLWEKMAVMAAAHNDQETLQTAQNTLRDPAETPEARLMREGIDLLYTRGSPDAAVDRFRQVLAINPEHYGATYQLAAALQRAGRVDEARPIWTKSLAMARAIKDEGTEALILSQTARPGRPRVRGAEPHRPIQVFRLALMG
jgi:Flp pilus assembly protein TadD